MIAGLEPRSVVEPPTRDALAECVAELYAAGRSFAFVGGGTQIELGNPPRSLDTVVRTTACNRVIEYAPADQTITVEAGITVGDVNDSLARNRQFLALDAPDPERTTIGGAIATNLYGRRRLRYGSIKDTIVGVELVRPDGTRARGGGKVVKNVAGFDIPKLAVGSLGTLGAIVSATFRVYPIEEQQAALGYRSVDVAQMMRICAELVQAQLVPASVMAYDAGDGERYDCIVGFEGFARGVEAQMKAARAIAVSLGVNAGAFAASLTSAFDQREAAVRLSGLWRVTLSAAPTALAQFLAATPLVGMRRLVYPMLGTAFVAADTLDAATIERWRGLLSTGSVIIDAMPAGARGTIDAWGAPAASALTIMRRIKESFDPKGLCNAGRFIGGL